MATSNGPDTVLATVTSRLRWAGFGRRLSALVLWTSVATAVAVLVIRLTGLIELPLDPILSSIAATLGLQTTGIADWTGLGLLAATLVVAVLATSLILATFWHERPTSRDAARIVDRHQGTKDLFLTLTMLEGSAGDYQPLVARNAVSQAARVKPSRVVPLPLSHGSLRPAVSLAVVAALVLGLPQLDPFGKVAQADDVKQQKKALEKEARKTKARAEQLATDDAEHSPEVKQAIDELKAALKKMKASQPNANRKMIDQQRKKLGELHKMIDAHKLRQTLNRNDSGQKFGQLESPKIDKWTRELQEGSTDDLKKELQALKKDLQDLAKLAGDKSLEAHKKRAELARKLQKKLRDIQSFASKKLDSKHPLAAALKRAKQQMKAMQSGDKELAESAQKHLTETMELVKQELQELAQTARDLDELEKALETARMAQKANDNGEAEGERLENAETLDDYREFYKQLMEQMGEEFAEGEGTGNRGFGKGGEVPEDDSAKTGFKTEISKSALVAGKVLLSLKTKGQSDTGDARQNYSKSVQAIRQGASEAIDKEEIPKGYIQGIKKYFQSLDEAAQTRLSNDTPPAAVDDTPKK